MDIHATFMMFAASFTALFAIVDPIAVIPVYLSMTGNHSPKERAHICLKASIIATGILLVFAVAGEAIFRLFGISIPAFRIAGGILLLLLGIDQLNAHRRRVNVEEESEALNRDDISIFPFATPLLAGPGAISTVVLQSSQIKGALNMGLFMLAIVLVFVAAYFLLKSAPYLLKILGKTGINLVTRIMGIILTAIAIQFIIDGLTEVIRQMYLTK